VDEEGTIRSDFNPSKDDNVLVHDISRTPGALGYFDLAYYSEDKGILKPSSINSGDG
jgi:phosphate transport system substrate-binding protein